MTVFPEWVHVSIEFGCEEENCSPETVPEHWKRNRNISEQYVVQKRMRAGDIYHDVPNPDWSPWSDLQWGDDEDEARAWLRAWRENWAHRKDVQFRLIKRTDWLVEG